jgi:2-polyprenyl-3-methyl-5-hydroxy-6-metoxy-1,4-benzoquinol methylase
MTGAHLSEWHSGYRAYSVAALADIEFTCNSDGFDFDTQIIVQLLDAGKTIGEVPIPTYYGDEICHVNGLRYARDVTREVTSYRLARMGFGSGATTALSARPYEFKTDGASSHGRLLEWARQLPPSRVLDLGCADGRLSEHLRSMGHYVVGVDVEKVEGVETRVDEFFEADLAQSIPAEIGAGFDLVVAADVIEHVPDPARLLAQVRAVLAPTGRVLVSVPNFAHWYPRARVALGRFGYDRRGILDETHLRFFTRRTLDRLIRDVGMVSTRRTAVGLPIDVASRGGSAPGGAIAAVSAIDRVGVSLWPTMFGYQFVAELRPR